MPAPACPKRVSPPTIAWSKEGDPGGTLYVLISGEVVVLKGETEVARVSESRVRQHLGTRHHIEALEADDDAGQSCRAEPKKISRALSRLVGIEGARCAAFHGLPFEDLFLIPSRRIR